MWSFLDLNRLCVVKGVRAPELESMRELLRSEPGQSTLLYFIAVLQPNVCQAQPFFCLVCGFLEKKFTRSRNFSFTFILSENVLVKTQNPTMLLSMCFALHWFECSLGHANFFFPWIGPQVKVINNYALDNAYTKHHVEFVLDLLANWLLSDCQLLGALLVLADCCQIYCHSESMSCDKK